MPWYIQLVIYIFSVAISLVAVYQIDFNKFMRIGKKQFSLVVWIIVSLGLGFLMGSLFIEIGNLLLNIK